MSVMQNSRTIPPRLSSKMKLFRSIFKGRQDIVPRHWSSKDGLRSGYSPLCRNEWKRGLCQRLCRTCNSSDYIPLSDALILDHFKGEHILAVYPLLKDNTCNFIAADFDNHRRQLEKSLLEDIKALYEVCQVQEIPCYVFRSKSGDGYHVYSFFDRPVPAWKARAVAFALLEEAGILNGEEESCSFDRLFPSQDELSGRGFGNLIALPFQGGAARAGQHTLFLDPESGFLKPYADQWLFLKNIRKVTETQLNEVIEKWNLGRQASSRFQDDSFSEKAEGALLILKRSCKFINFCAGSPEKVSEPLWYAMISNIVSIRPGGYSIAHKLSKGHPGYDRSETDQKIHHALDATGPHTCEYIMSNGFKCGKDCDVRSPVVLLNRARNSVGQ